MRARARTRARARDRAIRTKARVGTSIWSSIDIGNGIGIGSGMGFVGRAVQVRPCDFTTTKRFGYRQLSKAMDKKKT